jgi:hypothetical protein
LFGRENAQTSVSARATTTSAGKPACGVSHRASGVWPIGWSGRWRTRNSGCGGAPVGTAVSQTSPLVTATVVLCDWPKRPSIDVASVVEPGTYGATQPAPSRCAISGPSPNAHRSPWPLSATPANGP